MWIKGSYRTFAALRAEANCLLNMAGGRGGERDVCGGEGGGRRRTMLLYLLLNLSLSLNLNLNL